MTMTLKEGLHNLRKDLLENGYEIETERWQGGTDHPAFLEILHADMVCPMSDTCLLYTSPSPRDKRQSRMPSSA